MTRAAISGLLLIVLAGCSSGPALTPSTSPQPAGTGADVAPTTESTSVAGTPSPSPSLAPTPAPTATPIAVDLYYPNEVRYAPTFAMRVIVSGLNVRSRPSTSGPKITTALKNSVFLVSDWGTKANGYTWYFGYQAQLEKDGSLPVLPKRFLSAINALTGWLAVGTAASPFLEPVAPRCPTAVNLANVEGMLDSELATCFGTKTIELTGTYGCGGCGGVAPGTFTPDWLAGPLDYSFLSVDPATQVGPFAVHFPSDGPAAPPEGTIIKVTGHFNDPRSSSCVVAPLGDNDTPKPIAASVATAYCASRFVVTSFTVLGTDPSFPG